MARSRGLTDELDMGLDRCRRVRADRSGWHFLADVLRHSQRRAN